MSKRVAIIGYSFQLPGLDKQNFGAGLLSGQNLVTEVDPTRWSQDTFLHPNRTHPGTSYTFSAGSIGDVSGFDASFFGISPREAALMDPQQRKLLEWSWEALEDAGIQPSSIRGSACGVYIGIASADYSYRLSDDLAAVDSTVATGNTASIAANRLSYFFDLRGPSMAIDTACSSSLVAFHQACQSILSGENVMALTGGVSLHLHPYGFVVFSKASMLSRKGRCNVFDANGDGYVRSEGGGIFVLKDYDEAVADGNHIVAVVAGTAVNTDGRKTGLTVPSDKAQADLLCRAYTRAGISPDDLDYLEAHGTGTVVGDPIEARAIGMALGQARSSKPLPIGSIKSNVGHLETASGVAGLVKALYSLQQRTVPATIGIKQLNPNIRFSELNLEVVTKPLKLKSSGTLTIGINSFGFGGANAHVILQSPSVDSTSSETEATGRLLPVAISAKTPDALHQCVQSLVRQLEIDSDSCDIYDLAYGLTMRREWHEHRAVAYCKNLTEVHQHFSALLAENTTESTSSSGVALPSAHGPAFVYSGNGSQWYGMGRTLLAQSSIFRAAIEEIDQYFQPLSGFSLIDELNGNNGEDRYQFTEVAQPALFAIQVGVTRMLRDLGIAPVATMGHSVGEIAAAWSCGALSLADATHVIYHRSRLQGLTKGHGKMAAVGLNEQDSLALVAALGMTSRLAITGVNSSRGITIAGSADDLALLQSAVLAQGKFYRQLDLDYAFHSPAMDPIMSDVLSALDGLSPQKNATPFYSTVTGTMLDGEALNNKYWWHNVRQPVLFESAAKAMIADGINLFVEVGPHTVLRSYLADSLKDCGTEGRILPTLTREDEHPGKIEQTARRVVIAGGNVEWASFFPVAGKFTPLPRYPWQREILWHPVTSESVGLLTRHRVHPLLGYTLKQQASTWENQLDTAAQPILADHVVGDAVVFPGTGYVEMALAAARAHSPSSVLEVEELEIISPLLLTETQTKLIRTQIESADGSLSIRARDYAVGSAWTIHSKARIRPEPSNLRLQQVSLVLPHQQPDFTGNSHHALTLLAGLEYGPAFQCIKHGWVNGNQVLAQLRIPDEIQPGLDAYLLHPAILDCTFQLIIQLMRNEVADMAGIAYVPTKIGHITSSAAAGKPHYVQATLLQRAPHSLTASFALFDERGETLAVVEEARFRSVRLHKHADDQLQPLDYRCEPAPLLADNCNTLSASRIQSAISTLIASLDERKIGSEYAGEVDPLLDSLASHYIQEILQTCAGNAPLVDNKAFFDPESTELYRSCLRSAEQDQTIVATPEGWTFRAETHDNVSAKDLWHILTTDYPEYFPLVHAVNLGSEKIRAHLTDHPVGRKLSAPDYAGLWLTALGSARHAELSRTLARLFRAHVDGLASGQRFSIVETGAGAPVCVHAAMQSLDFSRCDYRFVAESEEQLAELSTLQEQNADLRLESRTTRETVTPDAHLVIVNLDFLSLAAAREALEDAMGRLLPNGVMLLIGRHRSRWLENIYPGQYDHPRNVAEYWQAYLTHAGLSCSLLQETSPGTLTDLFFLTATRSAAQASAQFQPVSPSILLLADTPDTLPTRLLEALEHAWPDQNTSVRIQTLACDVADIPDSLAGLADIKTFTHIVYMHGLRAASSPMEPARKVSIQTQRCLGVTHLLKSCEQLGLAASIWVVTCGAATSWIPTQIARNSTDSALWGFGRTLLNEFPDQQVRMLDVSSLDDVQQAGQWLARELATPDAEQEIVLDAAGKRHAPRMHFSSMTRQAPVIAEADHLVRLGFRFPGQLRNLQWESLPKPALNDDQLEIEIRATGLNFRDVMYALGLLSDEAVENGFAGPSLGLEFSGVVRAVGASVRSYTPGDKVVGFGPSSFANFAITSENAIARIPNGISFEAAATIPSVFFTVYYALKHLAQLQPGEKILIHGAAGGVGIAAIQLARHLGAEIHATAGSDEKRIFLRNLGVTHIYDSRSLSFADEIILQTGGEGVDVVLNSLAGEAINRNFDVLKPFGRFLELGKRDFYENTKIGLRPFRNNISYFGIDADQLMQARPALTKRLFNEVMQLFADKTLTPLPYQLFPAEQVIDAFRHMQQARQIGKIVVTYPNDLASLAPSLPASNRHLVLPADATYLVTGGLGGFGLQTAKWLVEKGARHLVLISRRGPVDEQAKSAIADMTAQGVKVLARACDITSRSALQKLFDEMASTTPPLRGIVHAAVVIDDALIRNTTPEQIERVLAPKVLGADYLDELTADSPLDFFVLYSSATTLFGNPGQASYVAANSYLESLAAGRRARGLPATCVRWGAIDDVGFLARNVKIKEALESRMGGQSLNSATALAYLEQMLLNDVSGLGIMDLDWRALARFLPSAGTPKFSRVAGVSSSDEKNDDASIDIQRLLAELDDAALQQTFVNLLKNEVGNILRIPADKIDPAASIYDMGLDSLMGVELVMALEERFGTRLPVMALSESPNVNKLAERLIVQLRGNDGQVEQEEHALAQLQQIAAQHGVSVDAEAQSHALQMVQSSTPSTSRIIH